jgi:aryl-alcohol dehydrogenase-like predicted oxidoreductase
MIYNVLEQDPGREFILAAERGPSYRGGADAKRGETNKKVYEPTEFFEPSFRAWKVDPGPQFLIRVTHSSGMLEGQYTLDTKFDESDHRSHRPRAWLVEGVQKVERLQSLCQKRGVTLGQLALLWLYAHPSIVSALPNIYNEQQIEEFAGASNHPALDDAEMEEIHQMYVRNFDIVPYVEEPVAAR